MRGQVAAASSAKPSSAKGGASAPSVRRGNTIYGPKFREPFGDKGCFTLTILPVPAIYTFLGEDDDEATGPPRIVSGFAPSSAPLLHV